MAKSNILFYGCKWLCALLLVLLLAVCAGVLWLQTGPKQISGLSALLISKLQSPDAPFELQIDEVEIDWSDWQRPASFRLHGVHVRSAVYDSQLTIPQGRVGLDMPALLLGRMRIAALELDGLALIAQQEETGWTLQDAADGEMMHHIALGDDGNQDASAHHVFLADELSITNGSVVIKPIQQAEPVQLTRLNVSALRQDEESLLLSYLSDAQIGEHNFSFSGAGHVAASGQNAQLRIGLQGVNPIAACQGWVDCTAYPQLDMPLKGGVALTLDNGALSIVNLVLSGQEDDSAKAQGVLAFAPHLPDDLPLASLTLKAQANLQAKTAKLETLQLGFATGTSIQAQATGRLPKQGEGFYLDAQARSRNMPVEHLYKYWPAGLAAESRHWATTRITKGVAPKASVRINISPEDLLPEDLPDDFLAATIEVQNADVNYIDGFPKAKDVKATVRFTGTTMTAELESAKTMQSSHIGASKLVFTDLNQEGTPIKIDLALDSNPQDTYAFMEKLPANALTENGISVQGAMGQVSANIHLAFDAFGGSKKTASGGVNWDGLAYKVTANAANLNGLRVKDMLTLNNATGQVQASNTQYNVQVKAPHEAGEYDFSYVAEIGKSQLIKLNAAVPMALVAAQAPELGRYLSGTPTLELALTREEAGWVPSGQIDLTQARVTLPPMKYNKPIGELAQLKIAAQPDAPERIRWDYLAQSLKSNGLLQYNWQTGDVGGLEVSRYLSADQDFMLRYQPMDGEGFRADVSGKHLDLSPLWQPKQQRQASISNMPPVQLRLNVQRISFPKGGDMRQVQGHVFCSASRCRSADIKAQLPQDGSFGLFIGPQDGARRFRLRTSNVGALLRMFDIHDKIHGGNADISGTYNDRLAGNPLSGRSVIEDVTVIDGPILATILNNASLTGLLDNLRGDGIRFSKSAANFEFADDLLRLSDGKAAGPSIGIIIEGDINIATNMLDLQGNLAPAHAINSLVGKIPLIGKVLVGGEGESIFAIDYGVKGALDDPSVVVNPLSALTPGFTRKFFDLFETPPDTSAPAQ